MSRPAKVEIILFSLVGAAGFVVDAAIVWALTSSGANAILAQAIAFAVAVTVTWLLNRQYTFAQHASPNRLREWMHYVAANSLGAVVNNGVYVLLVLTVAMFSKEPVLAVAAGSLAGLAFNFTASRAWVFRPR
ncbi:GtrA family protein [Acidithiobacillus ferrivorans SS3]|uniref:GtrA family protein n=1 Tax=Acidithiobacillus ferrivorans SS3 TaxID=743299 RepID=G0JMD1_9PROT|nr:GtrA family protein [Acidithiobacillus ferrivorans]AEM49293.1 GtrA family protein [Acidithiobacillus ferrivorans SS3]